MRVLITGGAGYIGTELCYALSKKADITEIVVIDNLSRANYNLFIGQSKLSDKIKFIKGDLLDTRLLKSSLEGIDIVYHLAAKVSTPFSDQNPHFFEQINHWGTAELVYAIEASDVKKFVYMSSISVYGASKDEMDVDSPINPRTFYGISKMRGEEHVNRLFKKLPTYILRCGNVYGYSKSMRFDAVINRFMFDANFHNRISINGSGEQHRSFIHIDDVSAILSRLTDNTLKPGRYDLVDKVLRVNDIAECLMDIYPNLEMIFVNQHMNLRELKVKPNPIINQLSHRLIKDLPTELHNFKKEFSF